MQDYHIQIRSVRYNSLVLYFMNQNQNNNNSKFICERKERERLENVVRGLCITITAVTAASTVYAYYKGLYVAPFSWMLPESELRAYRDSLQTAPRDAQSLAAATIGFYVGAVTSIVLSSPLVLWRNLRSDSINRKYNR